jgi:hypothetical protein
MAIDPVLKQCADKILLLTLDGNKFVGMADRDGLREAEAVFKTKRSDYVSVDISSGATRKYLTDPTVRQPSLFWRGIDECRSVECLASDLEFASEELKQDPDIVRAAIRLNGKGIDFAGPRLQKDPSIRDAAVRKGPQSNKNR